MRALRYTTDRSPKPRLTHPNQLGSRGSPLGRVLAGFVLASLTLCVFPGNAHAVNICNRTLQVKTAILFALNYAEDLHDNVCATVTEGQLAGITGTLSLLTKSIDSLQAGDFSDLTNLTCLDLAKNQLKKLPDGVFSDLTNLTCLALGSNQLSSLPDSIFEDLSRLQILTLDNNQLRSLHKDIFSNLGSLGWLYLWNNQLTSLPDGIFSKLDSLNVLFLGDNPGAPFTLTMELEETGSNTFVVKVREAAPFTMTADLTVSGGTLPATSVTVEAGFTTSDPIIVTPTPGSTRNRAGGGHPGSRRRCPHSSTFTGLQIAVGSQLTLTHAIQPRFRRLNNEILSKHALTLADTTIAAVTSRQEAGPRCAGQATTGLARRPVESRRDPHGQRTDPQYGQS